MCHLFFYSSLDARVHKKAPHLEYKWEAPYFYPKLSVNQNNKPIYDIVYESSFARLAEELEAFEISQKKLCIITDSKVKGSCLAANTAVRLCQQRCWNLHKIHTTQICSRHKTSNITYYTTTKKKYPAQSEHLFSFNS